MSLELLWLVHLAAALAVFAAALIWMDAAPRVSRVALGLALLPLLALAYLTWRVWQLRFGLGIAHAPLPYASALLGANILGAAVMWRRREVVAKWSPVGVSLGALALVFVEAVVLTSLHGGVLGRMHDVALEASRLAREALPPEPPPEENAAPLLEEATELLRALEEGDDPSMSWSRWGDVMDGEESLDVEAPELVSFLEAVEPALALVRRAGERPHFQPEQEDGQIEWLAQRRLAGIMDLGQSLVLSARVHLARGERVNALADLTAAARLADHLLDAPVLISALGACFLRGLIRDEILDAWRRLELAPGEATRVPLGPKTVDDLELALRLEEAHGLSLLGSMALLDLLRDGDSGVAAPVGFLGLIFLFDDEVRVYRDVQSELRDRSRSPRGHSVTPIEELATRGLATALMVPMLDDTLASMLYCDAEDELLGAALGVAEAWGEAPGDVQTLLNENGELLARFPHVRFDSLEDGALRLSYARAEGDLKVEPRTLVLSGSQLR